MASKVARNDNTKKKLEREAEKEVKKKIKKIKKVNPELTQEEENAIRAEERKKKREENLAIKNNGYREKYKIDYLSPTEMRVLHAMMTNEDKNAVALELGISLAGVYYHAQKQSVIKAFTGEMEKQYEEQKRNRKALYTDIATKTLLVMQRRIDGALKITEGGIKTADEFIPTKTLSTMLDKVVTLMQEEDGTKGIGINLTGGLNNTNTNLNGEIDDLNDEVFREGFTKLLLKTQDKQNIITREKDLKRLEQD
jgi:hypothetical protein